MRRDKCARSRLGAVSRRAEIHEIYDTTVRRNEPIVSPKHNSLRCVVSATDLGHPKRYRSQQA